MEFLTILLVTASSFFTVEGTRNSTINELFCLRDSFTQAITVSLLGGRSYETVSAGSLYLSIDFTLGIARFGPLNHYSVWTDLHTGTQYNLTEDNCTVSQGHDFIFKQCISVSDDVFCDNDPRNGLFRTYMYKDTDQNGEETGDTVFLSISQPTDDSEFQPKRIIRKYENRARTHYTLGQEYQFFHFHSLGDRNFIRCGQSNSQRKDFESRVARLKPSFPVSS